MTTSILILCFSVVVILLLTALLIRSSQDSDKREQRLLHQLETQTDMMEMVTRKQLMMMESASSDTADLATKAIANMNETVTNLFLGREQEINQLREQENGTTEREPTPGLETLEGLPRNIADALRREEHELTPPEWTVVSAPQPNGSEPTSESPWTLENDLPLS